MGLNIKNAEVERLAAEVAALTGETKTEAIRVALEERRATLRGESPKDRVDKAWKVLEEKVWPNIKGRRAPTREEQEETLGFGPGGV